MPSLGEVYDESAPDADRRGWFRVAAGIVLGTLGLSPVGFMVLSASLGHIGLANGTARALALAGTGLAVPLIGAGLLRVRPSSPTLRRVAAVGVLLASVAIGVYVATAGGTDPALDGVPSSVMVAYLVGVALALSSPLIAARRSDATRRPSASAATAIIRQPRSIEPRRTLPADGGQEEQQVSYLLDSEDR